MTTLTQAHRQWASRPADERFTSLTDMQAFAALSRQTSRSKVVSTREIELIPGDSDHKGLLIGDRDGTQVAPTHWSFGQLCSLASTPSPASYFRDSGLPTPIIADCLNYNLRFTRGVEDHGGLHTAEREPIGDDLADIGKRDRADLGAEIAHRLQGRGHRVHGDPVDAVGVPGVIDARLNLHEEGSQETLRWSELDSNFRFLVGPES